MTISSYYQRMSELPKAPIKSVLEIPVEVLVDRMEAQLAKRIELQFNVCSFSFFDKDI